MEEENKMENEYASFSEANAQETQVQDTEAATPSGENSKDLSQEDVYEADYTTYSDNLDYDDIKNESNKPDVQSEILATLKENQVILKKQRKSLMIRNIILGIGVFVFCILCFYSMAQIAHAMENVDEVVGMLDDAMDAVDSIQNLVDQIADEVEGLNLSELNTIFENLDDITSDIKETTDSLNQTTQSFGRIFR